jgi:hypothetical protein
MIGKRVSILLHPPTLKSWEDNRRGLPMKPVPWAIFLGATPTPRQSHAETKSRAHPAVHSNPRLLAAIQHKRIPFELVGHPG